MNCTLIPTLELIALLKIITLLWNQPDIRTIIFWFPCFGHDKKTKWQEVENAVIEKVSRLPLPKILSRHACDCGKFIGNQIFDWLDMHKTLYFGILHLPKEFCWTVQGLLDSRRTAEALIQDKTLHVLTRYKLACTYCLQKDVLELWQELPVNFKTLLCSRTYLRDFRDRDNFASLWAHEMQGKLLSYTAWVWNPWFYSTQSPYQNAFDYSVHACNKAAVEFFFTKLSPKEREDSLARCTEYVAQNRSFMCRLERYSNVLRFLMSHTQMEEQQQLRVFERYPCTLECLLEWPWQDLFAEKADRVWGFLSAEDYNYLLNAIVLEEKKGFQDWHYVHLFEQFWKKGTTSHKRYVLDECISGPLLTNLLKVKNMKSITLLVNDANAVEKEEIVYYRHDLVSFLILNGAFNLLKTLLEHHESSRDIISEFEREFLQRDLTSLEKKDLVEEKSVVKQFLKSLLNLFPKPLSAGGTDPDHPFADIDWWKHRINISWKTLKMRQLPKQEHSFKMKRYFV